MKVAPEPTSPDPNWNPFYLKADLERALDHDQFFLVYQPEIDLHTNAFVGVEALIRWRHPQRGVLSPDIFVPQLETSGQIVQVGQWALTTACAQGAEWHDKGYRFTVSVNISARQFEDVDFVRQVDEALRSSRFSPSLLVLEFSFSTLVGLDESSRLLLDLKKLGVRLAIDDFQPGRSQLDDLRSSPIDVVKLDRDFIATLSNSTTSSELVRELVDAAKQSHLQIVASGIEDDEQRRQLKLEAVDIGQGFHFSKPHEAHEIDRYLQDFAIFSGKPL